MQPSPSISLPNTEILINIPNPYALRVGYDTHEPLSDVPDLIIVVQELDVRFYCCLSVFISK